MTQETGTQTHTQKSFSLTERNKQSNSVSHGRGRTAKLQPTVAEMAESQDLGFEAEMGASDDV